jgi:hypothetical protein
MAAPLLVSGMRPNLTLAEQGFILASGHDARHKFESGRLSQRFLPVGLPLRRVTAGCGARCARLGMLYGEVVGFGGGALITIHAALRRALMAHTARDPRVVVLPLSIPKIRLFHVVQHGCNARVRVFPGLRPAGVFRRDVTLLPPARTTEVGASRIIESDPKPNLDVLVGHLLKGTANSQAGPGLQRNRRSRSAGYRDFPPKSSVGLSR